MKMCLLITQTNNKVISKEKLQNADKNNPDGMGFTYSDGNKLVVEKFRKFSEFYPRQFNSVKLPRNEFTGL